MPRERASIATWLVVLPAVSTSAPPRDQSIARKRDGARSTAATMAPGGTAASIVDPRQMRLHAIADVVKVCRTCAKILVVRLLVTGDFLLHRVEPRAIRGAARGNRGECRLGEHVVLEQRDLEFQYGRRVLGRPLDEGLEVGARGVERRRAAHPLPIRPRPMATRATLPAVSGINAPSAIPGAAGRPAKCFSITPAAVATLPRLRSQSPVRRAQRWPRAPRPRRRRSRENAAFPPWRP